MRLGLTEALHAIADGKADAIISVIGKRKRFTGAELQPRKLGRWAAICNDVGMTKKEREGAWRIA